MKILILGAGQVGSSLAEHLAAENHEVTLVDTNNDRLLDLQNRIDIRTVEGHCAYPSVLEQAGAEDADMLIAVTSNDEANILACQVAYSLYHTPTKIARIRTQQYNKYPQIFCNEHIPIDVIICPELLVTDNVQQLIIHPGALQVIDFAEGKVKLVAVKAYYGGPLLGKTIADLYDYVPSVEMRIAAIFRNHRVIPIDRETVIEVGDEVFFITASENVHLIMAALRRVEQPYKRILIAGGGSIGFRLAQSLESDYQIKLIDHNRERCEFLSERLNQTVVLCGDASDNELLKNENIENIDVFCAVTNDDEDNILSCLQAKKLGVKQVMALITRTAYVDLIEGGQINIAISPQQTMVGTILKKMRRGDVVNLYSLRRGAAEAIEIVAHGDEKTSKVVGRKIQDIKLPESTSIGAIVRGKKVLIPNDETQIAGDDHVILFVADKKHLRSVERLFQVGVGFFG